MWCRSSAGACSSEQIVDGLGGDRQSYQIHTAETDNSREHRSRRPVLCLHTTGAFDAVTVEFACLQAKVRDFAALSNSIVSFVEEDGQLSSNPSQNLAKETMHDLEVKSVPVLAKKTATKTQDTLVDANAEVAEIVRAVFTALTRLRVATIKEFDTFARLAIDACNDALHYRNEDPFELAPSTGRVLSLQRLSAKHSRSCRADLAESTGSLLAMSSNQGRQRRIPLWFSSSRALISSQSVQGRLPRSAS